MHQPDTHQYQKDEHGFVLITSLLFLVIITLLALSGITSSTLQQKMANNTSERASSLQAANNTLHYVETLIRQMDRPPRKNQYGYTVNNEDNPPAVTRVTGSGDLEIPFKNTRIAPGVWLEEDTWDTDGTYAAAEFTLPSGDKTRFRVTYHRKHSCTGLSASCAAQSKSGIYFFRITARSTGIDGNTPTITQSVYRREGF